MKHLSISTIGEKGINTCGIRLNFDRKDNFAIIHRGQLVMSARERPYLESLFRQFSGLSIYSVLEVGFGLGISATIIQEMIRPLEVHDIVEIETTIYNDLHRFSQNHLNVYPVLGDCYTHNFGRTYDFLFFDPYDYSLSEESDSEEEERRIRYQCQEIHLACRVLHEGGILCHPFFGDLEMPELEGFERRTQGPIAVPEFPLWDGSVCAVAQVGYYVKLSRTSLNTNGRR